MNNDLEQFSEETLIELNKGLMDYLLNSESHTVTLDAGDALSLIRIALSAKQAKPVAYMYRDNLHSDARFSLTSQIGNWSSEEISEHEITEIPLYTTPQPAHTEQDGWKLVPIEPTAKMIGAASGQSMTPIKCWEVMLAAAIKPETK